MAVILPPDLPARAALAAEGVPLLDAHDPAAADALNIVIFNLMPKKLETELQLSRMLGRASVHVSITLAAPENYAGKNAPPGHLDRFYRRWRDVKLSSFDAVIITGAPIETLPFEAVNYWNEMTEVLDWTRDVNDGAGVPLLSLCWGAQAALYRYYGVPKHQLEAKRFGVFRHRLTDKASPFLQCLDDAPMMPVSRWTETRAEDLKALPHLKPLLVSEGSGIGALADERLGHLHVLNHFEYDAETLAIEYRRDLEKGGPISPPINYFPDDDPANLPPQTWRANAQAFYGNWVRWVAERKAR
jgi:homoserine O-succinyltransferase